MKKKMGSRSDLKKKESRWDLNGNLHCVKSVLDRKNIVAGWVGGWGNRMLQIVRVLVKNS